MEKLQRPERVVTEGTEKGLAFTLVSRGLSGGFGEEKRGEKRILDTWWFREQSLGALLIRETSKEKTRVAGLDRGFP